MEKIRIDKWLWAARFYKTRSLSADEIERGRVLLNGHDTKPAREVKPGDTIRLRQGDQERTVVVRGLSGQRGPAPIAQALYEETAESIAARALQAERRRMAPEPAMAQEHGRPTKRQRRDLDQATGGWGARWSATYES